MLGVEYARSSLLATERSVRCLLVPSEHQLSSFNTPSQHINKYKPPPPQAVEQPRGLLCSVPNCSTWHPLFFSPPTFCSKRVIWLQGTFWVVCLFAWLGLAEGKHYFFFSFFSSCRGGTGGFPISKGSLRAWCLGGLQSMVVKKQPHGVG